MPHSPTWPSPILQYRAHAVHMILFVPSIGFQSSATLPIALPGGSRTSRTSGSEIIVYRYTGPIGLKHFSTGLPNPGGTEVLPALVQERFHARFRDEDVSAGGRDLADHREPVPLRWPRLRVPLEDGLDRVRADRGDQLVVAPVVQEQVFRDGRRQRRESAVPRERGLVDVVREVRHRRHLGEARGKSIGDVHAARDRAGVREEHAVGDPRIRPQELVEGLRPRRRRVLEDPHRGARAAEVSRDDDHVPGPRAGPQQDAVLPHAADRRAGDRDRVRLLRVAAEDRDAELPRALLHALCQPPQEFDVRRGGHRECGDEPEGPRARRSDVAQVHRGRIPADLRRRRTRRDVRLGVHDVRRDDQVVVPPLDRAAVVAQADWLAAVVDPREDLDRAALTDVGELRHVVRHAGGDKEGYGRGGSRARVHSFSGGGGGVFIRRQKYVAKTSTATTITIEPTITRTVLSPPNSPGPSAAKIVMLPHMVERSSPAPAVRSLRYRYVPVTFETVKFHSTAVPKIGDVGSVPLETLLPL